MKQLISVSVSLLCLLMHAGVDAEGMPSDPTEGALKLDLSKAEMLHGGKLLLIQGNARTKLATRLSLEGLSVMQPVVLSLLTERPVADVTLSALKPMTQVPEKTVSTDNTGKTQLAFRVQGDAIIQIQAAKKETPYQLMVWVGPELRTPMPSPFKSANPEALRIKSGATK